MYLIFVVLFFSEVAVSGDQNGSVGATPTVGQGGPAKAGVGKKKGKASQPAPPGEEKDPDGAFRVPGFRGVWLNTSGKHFIKVDGERLTSLPEGKGDLVFFGAIDEAAKKYDSILRMQKKKNHNQKMELNFKPDGTRFLYEDITPASTSGLGGSAANVVPALSVINIKVRVERVASMFANVSIHPSLTQSFVRHTGFTSRRKAFASGSKTDVPNGRQLEEARLCLSWSVPTGTKGARSLAESNIVYGSQSLSWYIRFRVGCRGDLW